MIEKASAGDLVSIIVLECGGFPASERWSGESWAAELGRDDHLVLVHRPDDRQPVESVGSGRPAAASSYWAAAGEIDAVAAFSVAGDFGDVLRVVVAPSARRQGLGAMLVKAGLAWMAAKGATRALLEVSTDNEAGIALYHKLGFEQLTQRVDYYGPGVDAWVMMLPGLTWGAKNE